MKSLVITVLALVLFWQWGMPPLLHWATHPAQGFAHATSPAAPDYAEATSWAALPSTQDAADQVPPNAGMQDKQANADVDVFFVHPTTYLIGRGWNAGIDNSLANAITSAGILAQQASVFNASAKVYAPRYRQVSQAGQTADLAPADKQAALDLAYSDVERAFAYFLKHYNQGRPFIIASHSQGTTHTQPLLRYLFAQQPEASQRLVAAYLIGNTVVQETMENTLPLCSSGTQTGCYISWNAILREGDDSHWQTKGKPSCVNPLSWRADDMRISAEQNRGALPMATPLGLSELDVELTGAQCVNGMLWIDQPKGWGYKIGLFPGGGYHAYDYNLFYANLRSNIAERVKAKHSLR